MGDDDYKHIALYLLIGGLSVAIDWSLFVSLKLLLGDLYAKFISYLAGAANSYFLNRNYTFGSSREHRKAIAKFLLLYLMSAIFNISIFSLLSEIFGVTYLELIFVTSVILCIVLNYLGMRYFVFK